MTPFPEPYWTAPGAMLYLGDVREQLRRLPARSVHTVVTSPPYFNQRDYGNDKSLEIGAESTPEEYISTMVEVFREIKRVLRDDGTCWLNLGDKYDGEQLFIPTRVALALRADGWLVVQDIIWHPPNKMPEPVKGRCTKSHEHIFLMAKSDDYYFDSVAIEEPAKSNGGGSRFGKGNTPDKAHKSGAQWREYDRVNTPTVNKRDVWIVPTTGYPGAHFAVWSPELITPCILAGTAEYGCCAVCNKPYERIVVREGAVKKDGESGEVRDRSFRWSRNGVDSTLDTGIAQRKTIGWQKTCGCLTCEVELCVVLDPFVGSGTTVATAMQLGRVGVGIDLSETYLRENAVPRIIAVSSTTKRGTTVLQSSPLLPTRLRGQ
jgi:DNA modification methylase